MKLYDFITHEEIEKISNCIRNEVDFPTHERTVGGHKFRIRSSRASCDWFNSDVKDGDYIISIEISTNTSGTSGPYGGRELKKFYNSGNFKKHLDKFLKDRNIERYEGLDEGQMDLFSLGG